MEGKGYTIYYDSWYSSILVTEKLTELKFKTITTRKKKSKYFPDVDEIKNSSKNYCFNNDKHCMIQLFEDKKDIYFRTNFDQSINKIRDNYNKENRGVDKFNQNISYYNIERKCYKWWKKILFFIIEISISNSKVLSDILYPQTKITNLDFKNVV